MHRPSRRPHGLKTVKVRSRDAAALRVAIAKDGRASCRDGVRVLVDEETVIGAVERVVQDGLVQPDLNAFDSQKWPIQRESVADLCGHGIADAFFLSAPCDGGTVRIAECDPDSQAAARLVCDDAEQSAVFGEEQSAVGKNADLTLG